MLHGENRRDDLATIDRETFNVFYSNVSAFSPHAKLYLSRLPNDISAVTIVECHKDDKLTVESNFRQWGYDVSYNIAEKQ